MTVEFLKTLNSQIENLLGKKDFNNKQLQHLIKKAKIIIYSTPNLHDQSIDMLVQARKFSQLNLFYTLVTRSQKIFDLAIQNVRFFYENQFNLPQSISHYEVKSIHLLFLLSSHRNQQFYSKLQNLTVEELNNSLIQYVFKINDAIQQGNYRRVFKLTKEIPLDYLSPFLDKISQTIRIEIAKSAQRAYSQLSVPEALQIFQLDNQHSLTQFITRYAQNQQEIVTNWTIHNNKIIFQRTNLNKVKFNSDQLIQTSLFYANELEKIA